MMATTPVEHSAGDSPRRPQIDARPTAGFVPQPAASSPALRDGFVDDLAIVRAVLDGDREEFRVLVDRESASVVRACYRVLGDLHEAEDVAQEAFVTAYRSLATWRGEGPLGAWLARIAIRLAVRQLGRRRAVASIRPSLDGAESDPLAMLTAEPRTQPEHAVLDAERAGATRRAVASLDEPYRETIALRFFGERSLEEIAALTGRPLGTVKTHLRRGLLRLRDSFGAGGGS